MTKKTWELYDPITILPDGGMPSMDGIIAYLDNPKKPTKLGIRLTGSSIGLGDHSGSVDGIDYFDCPLNSGVFVTPDQIQARTLSRIEQLRLKRELAAGQLDASKGGSGGTTTYVGGASGFAQASTMSTTAGPPRESMIGSAPPANSRAIAPQEKPQSISLNGLSATALARLTQLNPGYMDPNAPVNITVTPPVPEAVEENMDSDDGSSSSSSSEEEEYLKENRKHIGRLQQRKEEIRLRKLQLQQKKGGNDDDSDQPEVPARADEQATTQNISAPPPPPADTSTAEESRPLSRLEQLKLKKRQLESAPATGSTSTTATQPSTVTNLVSMAAAASPPRSAQGVPASADSEQVPWPFPATSREVSSASSLTSGSELGNNNNTTAPGTTVAQTPAPTPAPAEPLSRLEQLKLRKRKLEEGGPPAPKAQTTPIPTPPSPPPPPPPAEPHPEEEEKQQLQQQPTPEAQSMDRGAPVNGNGQQKPSDMTVQIMNSSTKRVKELQVAISNETNLFSAIYDAKSVKQANVRKWGTSFVQQVKEKKSEIRCRVTILSNPPPEKSNEAIIAKAMDLSVPELKTTTTEHLYNTYKANFYPQSSKIQLLLVCQPIQNGEASDDKLVSEPETAPKQPEVIEPHIDRSSISSIASTLKDVKHQLRIKIINERTRYFKDLLVETSQKINLYEAIYNNPAVKEAKVRKWNSSIVEQVRSGMAEIVCQICTIPNGKPDHLVKHGILTIEQLKECSTTELYTRYAMDHYDLENDESLIQLVLKCQQIKTPVASNQASKVQDKEQQLAAAPTRLTDSLPPATDQTDASRGNPVLETPPVKSRQIHPRASPAEASQSSLTTMENKPTNSPYAKAASAATPEHNTETKFSDLFGGQAEQQQPQPFSPNRDDPELGQVVVKPIATHPKTDAAVQTSVEITTPVRDNRQQTPQNVPTTFAEKLQQVDAYWWLAIIFILAAAFFAALFLGPVS